MCVLRSLPWLLLVCLNAPTPGWADDLAGAKARFKAEDRNLNEAYQLAKKELADWTFGELQADQRIWLEYRDSAAEQAAVLEAGVTEGGEEQASAYWETMADLTVIRTEIINGWRLADEFEKEWEGVWKDGSGGILLIEELGEKEFRFFVQVVRGPTYHLGALGGEANRNGRMARFAIQPEGVDEETWLTFLKEQSRLKVLGANTHYYHGARAFFDGLYVRVSRLDEESRRQVRNPEF